VGEELTRQVIEAKLNDFCARSDHGYWNGPFFGPPEMTVAIGRCLSPHC